MAIGFNKNYMNALFDDNWRTLKITGSSLKNAVCTGTWIS